MTELDMVLSAVCETIRESGIATAVQRYPFGGKKRYEGPVIAVGAGNSTCTSPGMAEYMGTRYDQDTDTYIEVYGKRMELVVCLDIYTPKTENYGQGSCFSIFGVLASALTTLPSGIRVREITSAEAVYSAETGMFCCACQAKCTVLLVAEHSDESTYLDFVVKGVAY